MGASGADAPHAQLADGAARPVPPGQFRELYEQGVAHYRAGEFSLAERALKAALALKHDHADAHLYLAKIHRKRGELDDAVDCLLLATTFDPALAEAWYYLGVIDLMQKRHAEARRNLEAALRIDPRMAKAHNTLGALELELGAVERAAACFGRALEISPDFAFAHTNLGFLLLRELGEFERGIEHIETALRLAPRDPNVRCNYTMALLHRGRLDEAFEVCDRLLAERPDWHEARLNRALAALKRGEFARAWPDYEARKLVRSNYIPRNFPFAEWRGEPLAGKSVLAYAEQGIGDEIMFASCLPDLIARAGHCTIECTPRLQELFARSFPEATVCAGIQTERDPPWLRQLGHVDYQVAVGSLPGHLRKQLADFPAHRGYLRANAAQAALWRAQLDGLGAGLKVGIAWRGGLVSTRRSLRSIPLSEWLPVLGTSGCKFISLQYDDCSEEIAALAAERGIAIQHWPSAFVDFDAAGALVSALDLVISVQTAVVHLCGALGRPAWVLVPAVAEWRYLDRGSTMPWYPSLELFRQEQSGDWSAVIAAVRARLEARIVESA